MQATLKHFAIPASLALGISLLLYYAFLVALPISKKKTLSFKKSYITYRSNQADKRTQWLNEQAYLFDSQSLFLPTSPDKRPLLWISSSLNVLDEPMISFPKNPSIHSELCPKAWVWERADEVPLLGILDGLGETEEPPNLEINPHIYTYSSPPFALCQDKPFYVASPAPLSGSLWPIVSYLVYIEEGRSMGLPLRESSTMSAEIDATLQSLLPQAIQQRETGYYRVHFSP